MKTKKYLIAIAILGGMLFTAYSSNEFNQNGEQSAKIEKKSRVIIAEAKIEKKSRVIIAEAKIEKKSRVIIA